MWVYRRPDHDQVKILQQDVLAGTNNLADTK
jgi:hypothetical protein